MPGEARKAVYAALFANTAIAVAKFVVAGISGSSAMYAEGVHSLVDAGNEVLLLYGIHRSRKPPDTEHPFGHGHEVYFWSLLVAVMIFGVGGGISMYKGALHLLHPPPLESATWDYVVLGVSAALESTSLMVGYGEFRKAAGRLSFWKAVRTSKDPSLFTVVLEDLADLAGLSIAFIGILLGHLLGIPSLDGAASVLIGLVLAAVALVMMRETRGLLIGESADSEMIDRICAITQADAAVLRAKRPLSMYFGPHNIMLALEVEFRGDLSGSEISAAVKRIEGAIRAAYPDVKQIFIEADAIAGWPAARTD